MRGPGARAYVCMLAAPQATESDADVCRIVCRSWPSLMSRACNSVRRTHHRRKRESRHCVWRVPPASSGHVDEVVGAITWRTPSSTIT